MNRINKLFEEKTHELLSVYFCAGYPTLNGTVDVIRTLAQNGIDMIEIGIPFSDPMADGPVIQQAATQALRNGMTLKTLFGQLRDIRKEVNIPLIMMGYVNPVLQYGFENFCRSCAACGIDGVILPDLPFNEYMQHFKETAEKYDIKVIMLITPETSEERIRLIDTHTDGFIYMVSSAAVTGTQRAFDDARLAYFNRINAMNLVHPRMIGFGIGNRQTLECAHQNAAGAIIGSRFIALQGETDSPKEAVERLLEALKS